MKLSKVLLGSAVAIALTFGFVGCDWSLTSALQKTFGEDIFKYNDATYESGSGTWTVDEKGNESTEGSYMRGVKLLLTKHSDIAGRVVIGNSDFSSAGAGVLGIAFDVSQNDDETWNFGLVGLQNNNGTPRYYVSYYYNIDSDNMSADNFGARENGKDITKTAYDPEATTPYEIPVKPYTELDTKIITDGVLQVVVDIDEDPNNGNYTINLYEISTFDSDNHNFNTEGATPLKTSSVDAETIRKDGAVAKQANIGVYGNIYPSKIGTSVCGNAVFAEDGTLETPNTLYGQLEILNLTNDAIVAE